MSTTAPLTAPTTTPVTIGGLPWGQNPDAAVAADLPQPFPADQAWWLTDCDPSATPAMDAMLASCRARYGNPADPSIVFLDSIAEPADEILRFLEELAR